MITGNEPAIPLPVTIGTSDDIIHSRYEGLTIRQHFAAMAMQGLMANPNCIDGKGGGTIQWVVKGSVDFADALIIELNKK